MDRMGLYEEGLDDREIAAREGVTRLAILNWRRRRDLPANKPQGGPVQDYEERFWRKVEKGGPRECWEWTGSKTGFGHGSFWDKDYGRQRGAHRVSYELQHGSIPDGAQVNHICGNPGCVNPNHLYAGTQADNCQDAIRHGTWDPSNNNQPRGEANPNAKLSEDDVREIRRRYDSKDVTQEDLAKDFEVSTPLIHAVVARRLWQHVD